MYIALSIIIVIAGILLTLVVLAQNSKGGGLAANFGAGNQTFGVRQTADLLEKLTWILAGVVIVLSIACTFFTGEKTASSAIDVTEKIQSTSTGTATLDFPATLPAEDQTAAGEQQEDASAQQQAQ